MVKKDTSRYKRIPANGYWFNNKSIKNLKGEKWKPIPDFEETHEVSNYGRVRCLDKWILPQGRQSYVRKGHLLSPNISLAPNHFKKDFTYHVFIGIETKEKTFVFSVRRLVYHCFIDNSLLIQDSRHPAEVVLPKDGNGFNTYYKNLFVQSWNDAQKGRYISDRTVSYLKYLKPKQRQAMRKKGVHKLWKPITQYDRTGRKIACFPSVKEAGKATGGANSNICKAASGKVLTAAGSVWRYGNGPLKIELPAEKFSEKQNLSIERLKKPVTQYDLNGKRCRVYKSVTVAASATGIRANSIVACLKGEALSAKGFFWRQGKHKAHISISKIANRLFKIQKKGIECFKKGKLMAAYLSIAETERKTGITRYHHCVKTFNGILFLITKQMKHFTWLQKKKKLFGIFFIR